MAVGGVGRRSVPHTRVPKATVSPRPILLHGLLAAMKAEELAARTVVGFLVSMFGCLGFLLGVNYLATLYMQLQPMIIISVFVGIAGAFISFEVNQ